MPAREHLQSVVASLRPVVEGVPEQVTGAPTPCPEWDVGAVANHLLGTLEAMRRVGADEALDPEDPWGTQGDHLTGEWRRDLVDLLVAFADAWSRPGAWEGEAMGGAMPKRVLGGMGYVEVMLHGWDLAEGSGQHVEFDDAAVQEALEVMEQIGAQGRSQGAFGPEVRVPDGAPPFHRVLAQAGRDPRWTAR